MTRTLGFAPHSVKMSSYYLVNTTHIWKVQVMMLSSIPLPLVDPNTLKDKMINCAVCGDIVAKITSNADI